MTRNDKGTSQVLPPGAKPSPLDVLMRRMGSDSDFPALSEAIGAINRIASSETEGVNELSNSILRDVALTSKLLRLANVAYYSQVGGGSISTVSRAVVILGFNAVRAIALSLILFENLGNKAHAQELKEEFIKVLYAGMLAREMAGHTQVKDAEEAFIGAMLHNLGRMLTMFYFPDEMAAIRTRLEDADMNDARASTEVLGVSFENLGIGVARSWGFPATLVQTMKPLPAGRIRRGTTDPERLHALAGFSNELCELVLETPEADRGKALAGLTARFGDSVPLTVEQLTGLMERSMQDIGQFALVVNVSLGRSDFAKQASKWAGMAALPASTSEPDNSEPDTPETAPPEDARAALEGSVLHVTAPSGEVDMPDSNVPRTSEAIQAMLASGLQDVSNSLIDDAVSLNDILRMILEAMFSSMGFAHVVLCIKDGRHNSMVGKFGFGDHAQALVKAFDFSLAAQPDVFLVALQNNADILISDIDDPKIAARIPAWYRKNVPARTFVLFPIVVKGKPIGLIYADRPGPGDITIPEKELSLLKSLRNQAVLAIRQSL
ncbi:MAG: HDOD domain-containing protein [Thiobacillus sp.]|uniref:HDOD domain-containing protein n=1 Tax=Thiobacillus sp. TaxID=924 RepID=UPI002732CF05|nr:HDOD domain-containing protein [Thiobacillus sp.]MDP3585087.1 HDOD domain-containing protein [Thiobacillus sp.]